MWHRLLVILRIRKDLDWAPPCLGPEVNHKYSQHATLQCCEHCGGGPKHPIHSEPFDARRMAEIEKIGRDAVRKAMVETAVRSVYAGAAQAQINAASRKLALDLMNLR